MGRDPNFKTVLKWAGKPIKGRIIPPPGDVCDRALLVHAIDNPLIRSSDLSDVSELAKTRRLNQVYKIALSKQALHGKPFLIPPYSHPVGEFLKPYYLSTCLRLWYGCMGAAKIIALATRSGKNTPKGRKTRFTKLHKKAKKDKVIAAGVEAAIAFKMLRGQDYSLEGIPKPLIRRYYPDEDSSTF